MAIRLGTRRLMITIAVLGVLMALPFQCETPQGELFRHRADRHEYLAATYRAAERLARAKGDNKRAEEYRLHAEWLEDQAWMYRQASYHHRGWPRLRLPGSGRISY